MILLLSQGLGMLMGQLALGRKCSDVCICVPCVCCQRHSLNVLECSSGLHAANAPAVGPGPANAPGPALWHPLLSQHLELFGQP